MSDLDIKSGDLITVTYEEREFTAIVIDPDGLGPGQPSVGFGFMMAQKHIGIPQPTLTKRVIQHEGGEWFKTPSGTLFRVIHLLGTDNNNYKVIEVSEWFDLAMDILLSPGQFRKPTKEKIGAFLRWFAIKGFYAEANVALKGVYTAKNSRSVTKWLITRQSGKPVRKSYTDLISDTGAHATAYGKYTNKVYEGLFGMKAAEMRETWALMAGSAKIARNHITEEEGLEAVKFCEDLVARIFAGDLEEAHDQAIRWTVKKFKLFPQRPYRQ